MPLPALAWQAAAKLAQWAAPKIVARIQRRVRAKRRAPTPAELDQAAKRAATKIRRGVSRDDRL